MPRPGGEVLLKDPVGRQILRTGIFGPGNQRVPVTRLHAVNQKLLTGFSFGFSKRSGSPGISPSRLWLYDQPDIRAPGLILNYDSQLSAVRTDPRGFVAIFPVKLSRGYPYILRGILQNHGQFQKHIRWKLARRRHCPPRNFLLTPGFPEGKSCLWICFHFTKLHSHFQLLPKILYT